MRTWFLSLGRETQILLSLGIILVCGFLATRITKKLRLPNVSGYIVAGILIGPGVLGLIPASLVEQMDFVSDIALAFIAFGVGRFFQKETLAQTGLSVVLITVLEALAAGCAVFAAMYWGFHLDGELSLLLGAIATATAPASTVMTIHQYRAKGEFVNTLLQVVALDDVVCLLVFSIVAAGVNGRDTGSFSWKGMLLPILYNLVFLVAGGLFGLVLSRLLTPSRSRDNRLILTTALLLALSGLCTIFDVSPLLSCMVFGAVYINRTQDKKLFRQVDKFTPPIMLLFFVVSGMSLDVKLLAGFGLVGIGYFLVRIAGKYLGAWLGCALTHREEKIRIYLGAALVPQAGVAIGLAYLSQRILPERIGSLLMSIILASSVLYELIGPACAKFALFRSGAIPPEKKEKEKNTSSKKKEKAGTFSQASSSKGQKTIPGTRRTTDETMDMAVCADAGADDPFAGVHLQSTQR